MRLACEIALLLLGFGVYALVGAQSPGERPDKSKKVDKADPAAVQRTVDRLMAFDKNKDGKLEKDEITDRRLQRLFERADANKDGVVTKEELTALATRMADENAGQRRGFGPPDGPPDGPGGPPGRFGPGGFRPPSIGQLLPPFLQERLDLSAEQKKQLDELQKEINRKLGKILTAEQQKQIQEMRRGFGPPGPGGPGGPPPGPPPGDGDGPPPPPR